MLKTACYDDKGDTWTFNISNYGERLGEFKVIGTEVLEDGIFRTKIKVSMEYNKSVLDFYYVFYEDEEYFDLYYKVNWNEKYQTLKFEFDVKNDGVTAGVPAGRIEHKSFDGDVPLHRWITFDGVSVITPSAFSYSASADKIGITILRSCIYGDYRMGELDYNLDFDVMQQGITEGKMRVMFGGDPELQAEGFCNECVVIDESNHDGTEKPWGSFLNVGCKDISLMALKYGEDDGIIIRLRETTGKETNTNLSFKEKTHSLEFKPHEIKTLKLNKGTIKEVNMLEL